MAATLPTGKNIRDGSIQRVDLDVSTVGQSVIAKAIQGDGIAVTSTGGDAGTGDVTINTSPTTYINSSLVQQTLFSTDTYLAGSNVVVPVGAFKAKGQYRCIFDGVKTAGTGAIVISVRIGTTGTVASDTAFLTFTFGVGTSVADTAIFEVIVNFRSVGSGTSAVVQGICRAIHNLATTGFFSNAAAWTIVATTSIGFNSAVQTNIGLSFNGSTAFAGGLCTLVQAKLTQ